MIAALAVATASVVATSAHAANIAFATSGTTVNFADPNFNNPSTTPSATKGFAATSGDALYFGASTTPTLNNNLTAGSTFASLNFVSGAAAFTINGNAFALGGNIANSSTTAKTINTDIDLGAVAHTVDTTTGTVTLSGTLSGTAAAATSAITKNRHRHSHSVRYE